VKARHIPNIISVFRIILVYPIVQFMLARRFDWSLALFIVAGISDALDGFLAKHFDWKSRLGSYLDPAADKLLLVACFLSAGWLGLIPVWLVAAVLLRDLVIVSGALAYYYLARPFEGQPHLTSKLNTFCQLLLIVAALFHHGIAPLPESLLTFLIGVVLLTTLTSGVIYVFVWGNRYWRETHTHG
jgi:cardiolipin synthase